MYFQPIIDFKPEEVLVYLRKSRSDDPLKTVEEVLEGHETRLDMWAEKHLGGKIPEENKFREVVSGETIKDRPKMQKILRMIESQQYKAVLVIECERLSRGDLMDVGLLIRTFRYTNTLILTETRPYDLRDEDDRERFERELKQGNYYLRYAAKIMKAGKLLKIQQGHYLGSVAPYGFERTVIQEGKQKCHTLKIKEDEAELVRLIFDLYVNKNMGRHRIVTYLDDMKVKPPKGAKWSTSGIREILCNHHYIGKTRWNWRKTMTVIEDGEAVKKRPESKIDEYLLFEGKHPAIISEELFYAAQARKGRNPRNKPNAKVRSPLVGLVYCGKCGRSMVMQTSKRYSDRLVCPDQRRCGCGSCVYDDVLNQVKDVLKQCITDFEIRIENNDADSVRFHQNLVKQLEKKLEELNQKEMNQWEKYSEEGMPKHIFDNLNEKVLREKEEVQQALCKAKDSTPDPVDYKEKVYMFSDALNALIDPNASAEEKNALLKRVIDRIEYHRDRPERETKKDPKTGRIPKSGTWSNPKITLDVKLLV